ncbi:hypothetical protein PoB_006960500 [Plakobranchus ocellatus]|uniref:Uncharacterized protein n=1 Tax=Plakobranchus ocellatus TaxID=259542 RepID=A0AAV4DGI1_9GAST|nr:hypothetical protein PoB_006960500 [Plakobranchus ocellatus]
MLLSPPSGEGRGSGAQNHDRRVPADLRADSQTTVPPTPPGRDRETESCKRRERERHSILYINEEGVCDAVASLAALKFAGILLFRIRVQSSLSTR